MKCPFCNKTKLRPISGFGEADGLKCDSCIITVKDMETTKKFIRFFRNPTHDNFERMIEESGILSQRRKSNNFTVKDD